MKILTDRELLELAAKSVGYAYRWEEGLPFPQIQENNHGVLSWEFWHPLSDDGDALRLAGILKLNLFINDSGTTAVKGLKVVHELTSLSEQRYGDKFLATRLAIVKLAAEIGKLL